MEKKRILILVSRLLQGGIDTVLIEYLKKIDRERFAVSLAIGICMEELEVYRQDIPADIPVYYLVKGHYLVRYRKQKVLGKLSTLHKMYDELCLSPIRRFMQQHTLDTLARRHDALIDFDSTFYSFIGSYRIPKIAFFHFSFQRYHNGNARKLKRLGQKLQEYDKIVTICDEMKREGTAMYPQLQDKFVTIYNAFDDALIRKKADEPIDEALAGHPYILAVQRLEESQKDLTTLLKAYKLLVERGATQIPLYVVGEGNSLGELKSLCSQLGIDAHIFFLGKQKNPYPWMKRCEVFVLSSKFEGLPSVLIEAMYLGCPIVSTACPTGPTEILDYGKAGALVPVGDEKLMADALERMLTDKAYRQELQRNMKEHVTKFSLDVSVRKIEDLVLTQIQPIDL